MGRQTFEAKAHTGNEGGQEDALAALLQLQSDGQRIVFLNGEVTENNIALIVAQMLHLANLNRKPITLVISTYGGSIDEMFSLYDTIKFLPCPVHTVALGKVMSAGVLLLASGEKGKRLMGASGRIMIHSVSGGVYGNVFEIENQSKESRRLHDMMVKRLARETKMSRKQIEDIMAPKLDFYLTAEKAVELGIVDKLIGA